MLLLVLPVLLHIFNHPEQSLPKTLIIVEIFSNKSCANLKIIAGKFAMKMKQVVARETCKTQPNKQIRNYLRLLLKLISDTLCRGKDDGALARASTVSNSEVATEHIRYPLTTKWWFCSSPQTDVNNWLENKFNPVVCVTLEYVFRCNELSPALVSLFPVFIKMLFMKYLRMFNEVVKTIHFTKEKSTLIIIL